MISRRHLFGLAAGAVVAPMLPAVQTYTGGVVPYRPMTLVGEHTGEFVISHADWIKRFSAPVTFNLHSGDDALPA